MRFIHTADWHLGNQMHKIEERKDDTKNFLGWLKKEIVERKVSALLISGDVFDTINPGTEFRRLYYSFLASLSETCCKNVIITGGNHDSSLLLDASKELLEILNIRVVGSVNNLSPSDMVFELFDENEKSCGICMAVPFVRETELRNYLLNSSGETENFADSELYSRAYKKLYGDVFDEAEKLRAGKNIPVIAMGHLYAADLEGRLSVSKSNEKTDDGTKVIDVLGTLGNVPSSVFPDADYVALGHVHYPTTVSKNPRIRYSGSPFVMGFDEANVSHGVLCVDLKRGEEPKVEKIDSPEFFVYKRIAGELPEIEGELKKISEIYKKSGDSCQPMYVELCYKKNINENAQDYLSEAIASLPEKVHVVSWKVLDFKISDALSEDFQGLESGEVKNLDDEAIFRHLILSKLGLTEDSEEGKSALEKFLPLFMQISQEVSIGQ